MNLEEKLNKEKELIHNIVENQRDIQDLVLECDIKSGFGYEDEFYRFYHQSFKVYYIQDLTIKIINILEKIKPSNTQFNKFFQNIINEGTGKEFSLDHNKEWEKHTRPILEAFFHAHSMLQLINKYGLEKPVNKNSQFLQSGWAAVLHLYNIR